MCNQAKHRERDRRRGQTGRRQASRQTNGWTDTINVQLGEAHREGQTKTGCRRASSQTNRWTDTINVQSSEAHREGQTKRTDKVQAGMQTNRQTGGLTR